MRPGPDSTERRKVQPNLLRDYEILYIVRPDVDEADLPGVTQRIESLIEGLEGIIQNTNVWGKRRLAYEVDHLKEGHYVLTDFQIEPVRVPEMEATLKISETVFRHLIVRKPVLKPGPAIEEKAPAAAAEPAPETESESETETDAAVGAADGGEPKPPAAEATASAEPGAEEEE